MTHTDKPLDFSDLERPEDLDTPAAAPQGPGASFLDAQAAYAKKPQQEIRCPACRGTGRFISRYTGRDCGDCYRCKGTGKTTQARLKARETWLRNKPERDRAEAAKRQAFLAAHRGVIEYLQARADRWDFAHSLMEQWAERGSLTENQIDAVHRAMERDALRTAERARAQAATREQAATQLPSMPPVGLDLSTLPQGYYAVPGGDTRLKVRVRRPEPPSKWAGWIFVSDGAGYGQGRNYGRQAPGRRYSGEIQEQLSKILSDPKAASAAYGQLTGHCGVCGRLLEDEESVARGIGPICFGKF